MRRVTITHGDDCWRSSLGVSRSGHSYVNVGSLSAPNLLPSHRVVYEMAVGPIPVGAHVHHRCGTPNCMNPDHLVPLDPAEHKALHVALQERGEDGRLSQGGSRLSPWAATR